MTRRMKFNDGEGLDFDDLNNIGSLAAKEWLDGYLRSRLVLQSPAATEAIRWLDAEVTIGGTRIIQVGGPGASGPSRWLRTDPTADNDGPQMIIGQEPFFSTTLDDTGAGFRRDIIELKIDEVDGVDEFRDFEDASTRALSSVEFDKRRLVGTTMQTVKGVEQTTEVLADANEPTPTSGFVKIYSILVDSAGVVDTRKIKDYTFPVGGMQREYIHANEIFADEIGSFVAHTTEFSTFGFASSIPAGPVLGRWIVPFTHRDTGASGYGYPARRIQAIKIKYQFQDDGGLFKAELRRLEGFSGPSAGTDVLIKDVTSDFTPDGVTRSDVLSGLPDPLWGTGLGNKGILGKLQDPSDFLYLAFEDRSTASLGASLFWAAFNYWGN